MKNHREKISKLQEEMTKRRKALLNVEFQKYKQEIFNQWYYVVAGRSQNIQEEKNKVWELVADFFSMVYRKGLLVYYYDNGFIQDDFREFLYNHLAFLFMLSRPVKQEMIKYVETRLDHTIAPRKGNAWQVKKIDGKGFSKN